MLREALKQAASQVLEIVTAIAAEPDTLRDQLYQNVGIGRHVRHVTDHFLCLQHGAQSSAIDYNQRNRESEVERDPNAARAQIIALMKWTESLTAAQLEAAVTVHAEILLTETFDKTFHSTFAREILYLINHTIHHAAYIKLLAARDGLLLSADIGIAPATASFQRQQAA